MSQKDIDAVDCAIGNFQRKLNHVPTSYNLFYHKSEESGDSEVKKKMIVEVLS